MSGNMDSLLEGLRGEDDGIRRFVPLCMSLAEAMDSIGVDRLRRAATLYSSSAPADDTEPETAPEVKGIHWSQWNGSDGKSSGLRNGVSPEDILGATIDFARAHPGLATDVADAVAPVIENALDGMDTSAARKYIVQAYRMIAEPVVWETPSFRPVGDFAENWDAHRNESEAREQDDDVILTTMLLRLVGDQVLDPRRSMMFALRADAARAAVTPTMVAEALEPDCITLQRDILDDRLASAFASNGNSSLPGKFIQGASVGVLMNDGLKWDHQVVAIAAETAKAHGRGFAEALRSMMHETLPVSDGADTIPWAWSVYVHAEPVLGVMNSQRELPNLIREDGGPVLDALAFHRALYSEKRTEGEIQSDIMWLLDLDWSKPVDFDLLMRALPYVKGWGRGKEGLPEGGDDPSPFVRELSRLAHLRTAGLDRADPDTAIDVAIIQRDGDAARVASRIYDMTAALSDEVDSGDGAITRKADGLGLLPSDVIRQYAELAGTSPVDFLREWLAIGMGMIPGNDGGKDDEDDENQ